MRRLILSLGLVAACGSGDRIYEELEPADSLDSIVISEDPVSLEDDSSGCVKTDDTSMEDTLVTEDETEFSMCDDWDGDGVCDADDNCEITFNPGQGDSDGDGIGNSCDWCPDIADHSSEQSCDRGGPRKIGQRCWRHEESLIVEVFGPGACKFRCKYMESICELGDSKHTGKDTSKRTKKTSKKSSAYSLKPWGVCVERRD